MIVAIPRVPTCISTDIPPSERFPMAETLPSFENPPVNEVVMGVQFDALHGLLSPHIGKFWSVVEHDYPNCTDNPPILSQIEDFNTMQLVSQHTISLGPKPDLPRVFLEDDKGHWLIQIQRDRFLHNWRIITDESEYPRYPEVCRRFFEQWEQFRTFVEENKIGAIRIVQLEITYSNRIPLPSSKANQVFRDIRWQDDKRALSPPESLNFSCSFKSQKQPKRLRTTIKPAFRDNQEEMRFELTVRGHLAERESTEDWFAEGRRWIVQAFADLTTSEWHTKWGRTQ